MIAESIGAGGLRILIADDHEAVREGLRRIIELEPQWSVCGIAMTGREAVQQTENLKPHIVVLDWDMPGQNGLEATRQIRRACPNTEVLIYTALDTGDLAPEAFEAGAKSVVSKSEAASQLVEALRSLSQRKPFFTDKVSAKLFSKILNGSKRSAKGKRRSHRLTTRERETLQLLAEGKSNKEVAAALGVSLRTAEAHRASLLRKLSLDSVAALVRYAIRNRIIQP